LKKLLFCYIDGMDLRRVDQANTSFIFNSLKSYPWVRITSPVGTDSIPTLLTGTFPPAHGFFGIKLKPGSSRALTKGLIDKLPDIFTTTLQCIFHLFNGSYDLPAIPPKRRRNFEILRTVQNKKYKKTENLLQFDGLKSLLGVIGIENCRYLYSRTSNPVKEMVRNIGTGRHNLEIVHLYSFDLLQRWNLDKPEKIERVYECFDSFVRGVYEKCNNNDITVLLFSDHGYDKMRGYIDLKQRLKMLGLSEEEYTFFIELSMARFWFFSDRARNRIVEMLREIPNSEFFFWKDLQQFNISFSEPQYGEAFIMSHPGFAFFPHDFHHPIANLFLGITDPKQRPRVFNPRHRGEHSLLPNFESAKGFMLVLSKDYESCKKEADLIDVSPTILEMLGIEKPDTMIGSPVFKARENLN
jgi:hypothetical protein